jgi:hypothetical protein
MPRGGVDVWPYCFFNLCARRGGWSTPFPTALPPGKTRYPLCRSLGEPQGRSGRVWRISPPPGFEPLTVDPGASRYTDWAIPASVDYLHTNHYFIILLRSVHRLVIIVAAHCSLRGTSWMYAYCILICVYRCSCCGCLRLVTFLEWLLLVWCQILKVISAGFVLFSVVAFTYNVVRLPSISCEVVLISCCVQEYCLCGCKYL